MTARKFIAVFALLAALQTHAAPSDAQASMLLVGIWAIPRSQYPTWSNDGEFVFSADGTFTSYGIFRVGNGEDLRVDIEGKWSVKDGILKEELTKSSRPQMLPVGLITQDAVLAVTEKEFRFRNVRIGARVFAQMTPNHAMESTASGCYDLPFADLNPYPVAMHPFARGDSSWSR